MWGNLRRSERTRRWRNLTKTPFDLVDRNECFWIEILRVLVLKDHCLNKSYFNSYIGSILLDDQHTIQQLFHPNMKVATNFNNLAKTTTNTWDGEYKPQIFKEKLHCHMTCRVDFSWDVQKGENKLVVLLQQVPKVGTTRIQWSFTYN